MYPSANLADFSARDTVGLMSDPRHVADITEKIKALPFYLKEVCNTSYLFEFFVFSPSVRLLLVKRYNGALYIFMWSVAGLGG